MGCMLLAVFVCDELKDFNSRQDCTNQGQGVLKSSKTTYTGVSVMGQWASVCWGCSQPGPERFQWSHECWSTVKVHQVHNGSGGRRNGRDLGGRYLVPCTVTGCLLFLGVRMMVEVWVGDVCSAIHATRCVCAGMSCLRTNQICNGTHCRQTLLCHHKKFPWKLWFSLSWLSFVWLQALWAFITWKPKLQVMLL